MYRTRKCTAFSSMTSPSRTQPSPAATRSAPTYCFELLRTHRTAVACSCNYSTSLRAAVFAETMLWSRKHAVAFEIKNCCVYAVRHTTACVCGRILLRLCAAVFLQLCSVVGKKFTASSSSCDTTMYTAVQCLVLLSASPTPIVYTWNLHYTQPTVVGFPFLRLYGRR